jgi:hypothetical protein
VSENGVGNFAEMTPLLRDLGIFYMLKIYDMGPTVFASPPKKGTMRIFSSEKSDGFVRV